MVVGRLPDRRRHLWYKSFPALPDPIEKPSLQHSDLIHAPGLIAVSPPSLLHRLSSGCAFVDAVSMMAWRPPPARVPRRAGDTPVSRSHDTEAVHR